MVWSRWLERYTLMEMEEAADYLGLERWEWNDPSAKCMPVLMAGPREFCGDFRGIRRWVMCRAWQLLDEGLATRFRDAIRQAWSEAKQACPGV